MERNLLPEELLRRIGKGDTGAFEDLYQAFAPKLYRYLRLRLRQDEEIHDVLQESFVTIWRTAEQFRGDSSAATWLFGIARHKLLDWLRRNRRIHHHEATGLEESLVVASSTSASVDVDTRIAFAAAIEGLSEAWRELAYLVFVEGWPYKDIAGLFEVPEGTVKSRVFKLKQHLRECMREEVSQDGAHVCRSAKLPALAAEQIT